MKQRQTGFTLVELVIVILILGILAATALPKFMNVGNQAHQASVAAVGGALSSAISLSHAQWVANGSTGQVDNVANFGNGDVDTNALGWPVGTDNGNNIGNAGDCVAIWNGTMQNPPSVATAAGADYRARRSGQVCTYIYQAQNTRSIIYDASNGSLTVNNP